MLAGVTLLYARAEWRARRPRRSMARARRDGRRGEQTAVALLEAQGYEILATQVPGRLELAIDGEAFQADVRADFLVRRRGRTYIAEAKTGASATPTDRATRRQLLEYLHAYDVDGVLLVDATGGRVSEFGLPSRRRDARFAPFVTLVLAAATLWLALR